MLLIPPGPVQFACSKVELPSLYIAAQEFISGCKVHVRLAVMMLSAVSANK